LNLAGDLWDSVLIAAGATVIHSTTTLLQNLQYYVDDSNKDDYDDDVNNAHQSYHQNKNNKKHHQQQQQQHSTYQKSSSISSIDIILIDPYEYVISYYVYNSNHKNTSNIILTLSNEIKINSRLINSDPLLTITNTNISNNNSNSSSSSSKKQSIERPMLESKLNDIELITTYKCFHYHYQQQQQQQQQHHHQQHLPPTSSQHHHLIPFVASTDWLIHCLALNEVIDINLVMYFLYLYHLLIIHILIEQKQMKEFQSMILFILHYITIKIIKVKLKITVEVMVDVIVWLIV